MRRGYCEVCGGAMLIIIPFYNRARWLREGSICTCPGQTDLDDKYMALKPHHKEAIRKYWEDKGCALTVDALKEIFADEAKIKAMKEGYKAIAKSDKAKDSKPKNKKRREILDFARDNKLVIHPGRGYDYYIDSYFMFNRCPCDATRLDCPCNEAVAECKETGWCKCRLYWRDYDTFKDQFIAKEES
jgi:hypothetical protein